jgi:hypothetical protein
MSSTTFPQKYYSLRYENAVVDASIGASGPDAASLAAIEALMLKANQAYWNRKYQAAIADYKNAAGKIYALIDPKFNIASVSQVVLPREPALFEGFVSAAAEYLNVLPVNQVAAGPLPRVTVDPKLLAGNGTTGELGVQSALGVVRGDLCGRRRCGGARHQGHAARSGHRWGGRRRDQRRGNRLRGWVRRGPHDAGSDPREGRARSSRGRSRRRGARRPVLHVVDVAEPKPVSLAAGSEGAPDAATARGRNWRPATQRCSPFAQRSADWQLRPGSPADRPGPRDEGARSVRRSRGALCADLAGHRCDHDAAGRRHRGCHRPRLRDADPAMDRRGQVTGGEMVSRGNLNAGRRRSRPYVAERLCQGGGLGYLDFC